MSKVAEMFAEIAIRDARFNAGLSKAEGAFRAFGGRLDGMASGLAARFNPLAGIIAGITASLGAGAGIGKALSSASDLAETLSKVSAVFGDSAGIVTQYGDDMAKKFGIVKKESLDAAAQIGLIGKASGLSQANAAALGVEFAGLAADLSSFNNAEFSVALDKIRAGLVGEAEPLRQWGILLSEAAVQAKMVEMGLAKSEKAAKNATDAMKVMARAAIIRDSTRDAAGDLARTAGGFANLWRKVEGQMENLFAKLGDHILPSAVGALEKAVDQLDRVSKWTDEHGADQLAYWDNFSRNLTGAAGAAGKLGDAVGLAVVATEHNLPKIGDFLWKGLHFMATGTFPADTPEQSGPNLTLPAGYAERAAAAVAAGKWRKDMFGDADAAASQFETGGSLLKGEKGFGLNEAAKKAKGLAAVGEALADNFLRGVAKNAGGVGKALGGAILQAEREQRRPELTDLQEFGRRVLTGGFTPEQEQAKRQRDAMIGALKELKKVADQGKGELMKLAAGALFGGLAP